MPTSRALGLTQCFVWAVVATAPANANVRVQERRALAGVVVDDRGEPVAGATVQLATSLAAHLWLAAPELLTATTDAAGRFRVEAQVGRSHAGGAVGPIGADGATAVSALVQDLAAGEFVSLRLQPARSPARIRVDGGAAWGTDAPRRLRVAMLHAPGLQWELALDVDGEAMLPPVPAGALLVELLDARGDTMLARELTAASGDVTIALPPPRALRVLARDRAGRPVAGATIAQRTVLVHHTSSAPFDSCIRERWRTLGATGADGVLQARITAGDEWLRVFTARAPGAATAVGGLLGGAQPIDARRDPAADAGELHLELGAPRTLTGSVRRTAATPLAAASLWLEVTHALALPTGGSVQVPMLLPVTTDADGVWRADALPAEIELPRLLAPPSVVGRDGLQLPPILADGTARAAALDPVVLAAMPVLELAAQRADGGPAEGAVVAVVPTARRRWFVEPWDARYRLDRAGRARIVAPSGPALLFCTDGQAFAEQMVDERTARAALRLEPLQRSTLRIRTPANAPAAGTLLQLASYSPPVDEPDPRRQARGAVAVSLHAAWIDGLTADATGRVELRTVPHSGLPMAITFVHPSGTLVEMPFTPGDRDVVLERR